MSFLRFFMNDETRFLLSIDKCYNCNYEKYTRTNFDHPALKLKKNTGLNIEMNSIPYKLKLTK